MDMTDEIPSAYRTTARRPGPIGLVVEALSEVRSRRRLIGYLARADLKKKGVDTLFGNIWWVLDPLLQMAVYVVLVTLVFQRSTPAYPLFVFCAILPWKWFGTSMSDAITSVSGQDKLIKQIQFPKIILPLASLLSATVQFAFGIIPLLGMLILMFPDRIHLTLLFVPVIAVVQFVFTLGLGLVVAGLNVFFRDVGNLARHFLRLWFYLSPALYGADSVAKLGVHHPTIVRLMQFNPFYWLFTSYRNVIYEGTRPEWAQLGIVLGGSAILLVVAMMFFKRLEPAFAKVL
jgi:ABC-type polysaccharide/polyol phosphate export permease